MKRLSYLFGFLGLVTILVWGAVLVSLSSFLRIIACDVGQGDAILAVYRNTQVLIDGGPDNKVLDCLGRYIPFWDREIELIILTHPQKDHYQGLIEVVRRYKVEKFLATGLDASASGYQVLKNEVGGRGIEVIHAERGMILGLGMISLEIVHPSSEYLSSNATKEGTHPLATFSTTKDPNNFSIVAILRLGKFDALFTGDLGPEISDALAKDTLVEAVEYLKVPHHGSRNGLTQALQEKLRPQIAVISASKDNSYGHPHQETLEILTKEEIKIFRTDLMGDVEIVSDGKDWWVKSPLNGF